MPHQPQLIPDEPTPEQAARDAERAAYLDKLRQKLQDPDFRNIEGFPIAEDEAILTLSDPPYYTACPNPFLPEIIERWQTERDETRAAKDDHAIRNTHHAAPSAPDSPPDDYHREPFAADVSEGKNDPIYNAHSYHTKVPHKAIMRYILHYTEPGDIVFDGFCGTGMTGVAAQLCGEQKTVQSLGYQIKKDGTILDEKGQPISRLGARKAVLCDLSPAATFIAYNYNTPVDVKAFEREAARILQEVEAECGWMYETLHTDGKTKGKINYTVWSDVFQCPECGTEIVFWDVAVDEEAGKVLDPFLCPQCGVDLRKRNLERTWEIVYDSVLNQTIRRAKQAPVLINYSLGKKRYTKQPNLDDLDLIRRVEESNTSYWLPTDPLPDGYNTRQPMESHGITHAHHFYTLRNLLVLASIWDRILSAEVPNRLILGFCFTANLRSVSRLASIAFSYYFKGGGGPINAGTKGTLYVSSTVPEVSVLKGIAGRIRSVAQVLKQGTIYRQINHDRTLITTQSSSLVDIPESSVDYVFIDPPFGGNLMYSELSFYWETWLRATTNNRPEAIVNKVQQKGLLDYQHLMEQCFHEFYRVLKPGRWMTVEFHNSQNAVWNAIQEAILRAGFMVADVRSLDKKQGSFKQYTTSAAVKQDLIISAYKPHTDFEQQFLQDGGRVKGVWEFVDQHLEQLPAVVQKNGALEVVAERQAYLLYDRMVAFHIQRGFSVPLSAAEFYAGLKQRFPERDGMYFLPAQAVEYDKQRLRASRLEQLALFVIDEKSAIQWLNRELNPDTGGGPQTYQDLQPKFLRELHQARHEKLPELRDILEENFIQDDQERWLVPNPERLEHMEQLRERSLLREFQAYAGGKGRLKIFRTEAVRTGFKRAWANQDYRLIVTVAQRLPESVLQEDPGLLMYYDNALMRVEKEPVQGRLL